MAQYDDREHYIPIRRSDLIELLVGSSKLSEEQKNSFRQFCKLVNSIYHFEYHDDLENLKKQYYPFDPDAISVGATPLTDNEKDKERTQLYEKLSWLLARANYTKLTKEQLIEAGDAASAWGINLEIDFDQFEHLDVYVRGSGTGKRLKRHWLFFWRMEEVSVDIYQRVVIVLKQKPSKKPSPNISSDAVYLKIFKDIPQVDIEMLLPGGKVKMPKIELAKLGASLLAAIGMIIYKVTEFILAFAIATAGVAATLAIIFTNPIGFFSLLGVIGGYGYKQYAGYRVAQQTYNLQLTESLYYQNLDSNAGVLVNLFDEAEEQECREVILGYYYLWAYAPAQGWTAKDLDDYIEIDLEQLLALKVDFEIEDALVKLEANKLVQKNGDRYTAVPIEQALEVLDHKWDNYFQYNQPKETGITQLAENNIVSS
ncbi:MAG: TMEM143 family protein [Gemmataceae bacterium]